MKVLVSFLILLLSTQSHAAVHLSTDGKADAAIVPYYSVANGLNTLLSIKNTHNEVKALKVHIREARNGHSIYSFNLYLKANDTWTAALYEYNGALNSYSIDESCTFNFNSTNGQPTAPPDDSWTWQTGTIEIIEMGVVDTDQFTNLNSINICDKFDEAWNAQGPNSLWRTNNSHAMLPASGGIKVRTSLVNVFNGFSVNVPTISLSNFFADSTSDHQTPESEFPDLSSGDNTSLLMHQGQAIKTLWPTGYEAISALLVKTTLDNEYDVETVADGVTEWVISFPTLRYHKNNPDSHNPFIFEDETSFRFPGTESNDYHFFDRRGQGMFGIWACVLPPPGVYCPPINFLNHTVNTYVIDPWETEPPVSVLSGSSSDAVRALNIIGSGFSENSFTSGSVSLLIKSDTNDNRGNQINAAANDRGIDADSEQRHLYHGLPVVGFAVQMYKNGQAQPGLLAVYATAEPHTGDAFIETEGVDDP